MTRVLAMFSPEQHTHTQLKNDVTRYLDRTDFSLLPLELDTY